MQLGAFSTTFYATYHRILGTCAKVFLHARSETFKSSYLQVFLLRNLVKELAPARNIHCQLMKEASLTNVCWLADYICVSQDTQYKLAMLKQNAPLLFDGEE